MKRLRSTTVRFTSYLALAALAVTVTACSTSGAAVEIGSLADPSPPAVTAFLEGIVSQRGGPPSVSVAVAADGEIVLAEAVGFANVKKKTLATPTTAYRAYSISKGITAVAVMQLVESDAIALDDDIRSAVQAFPEKQSPITVEQLLTHTSGIRHYKKNAGEISSRIEYPTLVDSLVVFKDDPLQFEPGTAYGYTTFGFNLLTGAVEHATGLTFGEYLEARIFGPAGMSGSGLATFDTNDANMATGYSPGKRSARLPNVSGRYGSSGVLSTPSDLVRLFVALENGTLMAAATRHRMYTVAHPKLSEQQAFGWRVTTDRAGRRLVYGTGGGIGFTGLVFHYPDDQVTGALLVNEAEFDERMALMGALLEPFLAESSGTPGP